VSGGQEQAAAPAGGSRVERAIVLVLFLALVGLLVFILLTNPTFNSTSESVLYLILSMVGGLLGAFLPGAVIHVEGGIKGLSVRATGGAGFFALVFFGLPWLRHEYLAPPPPPPELLPIETPDLRAAKPDLDGKAYLASSVALIIPVGFKSSHAGSIDDVRLSATLDYGDGPIEFLPYHMTALSQGVTGDGWIPNLGNTVGPLDMTPGEKNEIAFYAVQVKSWERVVADLVKANPGTLKLTLHAKVGDLLVEETCNVNFANYRAEIDRKTRDLGRYPARISMRCLP